MSEENNVNPGSAKFMTNIYTSHIKTKRYYKSLEYVTKDANIPTDRLLISMFVAAMTFLPWIYFLISDGTRVLYVILPTLLGLAGVSLLVVMLIIPARESSMLVASLNYIAFLINERIRRQRKKHMAFESFGIESFKNGLLKFDDGRYGLVYFVEGFRSNSILPQIVVQNDRINLEYMIARPETTQQTLITSVQQVDVSNQLDNLLKYHQMADEKTEEGKWRRYMATMQYEYIQNVVVGREYTIQQVIILSDYDIEELRRSKSIFEQYGNNGLLASYERIMSIKPLTEAIGGMTMISRKGERQLERKERERREAEHKKQHA